MKHEFDHLFFEDCGKLQNEAIERGFQKRRRDWIDEKRKTNPTFAPDIESAKELLSPRELAEVLQYEAIRHRLVARQGPEHFYKPYKVSKRDKDLFIKLAKKYHHIYYEPDPWAGLDEV